MAGEDITDLDAGKRDVAMVFQNYALYPTMSVRRNIGFGLFIRRTPQDEIERKVGDVARTLNVEELLDRKPQELSGGQRQRVAIARAMVRDPRAFLMDEPLSNLDARLRVAMRAELKRLHERLGATILYVTHDQVEAMTLGNRVAVIRDGELQQFDTPRMLFERPANMFVAGFIGSPAMNLVSARLHGGKASFAGFELRLPGPLARLEDQDVIVGIRPTHFDLAGGDQAAGEMEVNVEVVEDLGTELNVIFFIDAPSASTGGVETEQAEGRLLRDTRAMFTARLDARSRVQAGDRVRLAVDMSQVQLFDAATFLSLSTP